MTGLFYVAMAAQFATLVALWLRRPSTLYLQAVPIVLLLLWVAMRFHQGRREYHGLEARRRAHEREIMAMLDGR